MFKVKKKKSNTNITLRMPEKLLYEIRVIAEASGTSISQIVFQACEYALKSMKNKVDLNRKGDN